MKTKKRSAWGLKPPLEAQRGMAVMRPEGANAIRVSHRAARRRGTGWIVPRYLLRCGDCDNRVEIHYDEASLEINGVHGSLENWREILLPLLNPVPGKAAAELRRHLKEGAIANARRDLAMAADRAPLEEEAWEVAEASRKKPGKTGKKAGSGKGTRFPTADGDYTPAQRKAVDAQLADIEAGRTFGPFGTHKEFVDALHKEAKKAGTKRAAKPKRAAKKRMGASDGG